jgi:hypothetical protein
MRSEVQDRESAGGTGPAGTGARAARWVWWGLLAGLAAVMTLSLAWALRAGSYGKGVNRGPADEAAPGAKPSQHIDRSRPP